jgi:hypothetical protein
MENYQSNLILLQEIIAKLRRFIDIKIPITHLAINICYRPSSRSEKNQTASATNDSQIKLDQFGLVQFSS